MSVKKKIHEAIFSFDFSFNACLWLPWKCECFKHICIQENKCAIEIYPGNGKEFHFQLKLVLYSNLTFLSVFLSMYLSTWQRAKRQNWYQDDIIHNSSIWFCNYLKTYLSQKANRNPALSHLFNKLQHKVQNKERKKKGKATETMKYDH